MAISDVKADRVGNGQQRKGACFVAPHLPMQGTQPFIRCTVQVCMAGCVLNVLTTAPEQRWARRRVAPSAVAQAPERVRYRRYRVQSQDGETEAATGAVACRSGWPTTHSKYQEATSQNMGRKKRVAGLSPATDLQLPLQIRNGPLSTQNKSVRTHRSSLEWCPALACLTFQRQRTVAVCRQRW